MLEIEAVRRAFRKHDGGELLALDGIQFAVAEGEFVGLLGRSGSAKSTLLRLIAGLSRLTAGRIAYLGQPISGPAPWIVEDYMTPGAAEQTLGAVIDWGRFAEAFA